MKNDRQKENLGETIKNAIAGYAVVILGFACFLLLLAAIATVVRIIVGASTGVTV